MLNRELSCHNEKTIYRVHMCLLAYFYIYQCIKQSSLIWADQIRTQQNRAQKNQKEKQIIFVSSVRSRFRSWSQSHRYIYVLSYSRYLRWLTILTVRRTPWHGFRKMNLNRVRWFIETKWPRAKGQGTRARRLRDETRDKKEREHTLTYMYCTKYIHTQPN